MKTSQGDGAGYEHLEDLCPVTRRVVTAKYSAPNF